MELALEENLQHAFENVFHTVLLREETMEAIVPDACPDILRLLDTAVTVELSGKQVRSGHAEISAAAVLEILYLPEGGGSVQRLTMNIPFRVTAESPALTEESRVTTELSVRRQEVRTLHSRKVLARLEICLRLDAWEKRERNIPCRLAPGAPPSVQLLTAEGETTAVTGVEEKAFTFSDTLELPSDLTDAALMTSQVSLSCGEARVLGSKLVVKGEARLSFLLLDREGALREQSFQLPFSQVLDCVGVEEEALCSVLLTLTHADFRLNGGRIDAELGVLLQAVLRESRSVTYLTDLYSTEGIVTPQTETLTQTRLLEHGTRRQPVREVLETGTAVSAVLAVRVRLGGGPEQRYSEGMLSLPAEISVLYRDGNGGLGMAERTMSVMLPLELPEDAVCQAEACLEAPALAAAVSGGLEVRFAVVFTLRSEQTVPTPCIVGAALSEEEEPAERRPSLVLRRAPAGQRLWDVAKSCGSTVGAICAANGIEGDTLAEDRLLLIPRCR